MTTPNGKIGRGIDALERQKSGGNFNLSGLVGAPSSVSDLNALAELATRKRDRLKVLAESTTTAIEKKRHEIEVRYADFGKVRDGNHVTDTVGDSKRRAAIEREVSKFTRDARKVSDKERGTLIAELRENSEKIAAVKSSWTDPVALLSRISLSDPKRATYAANLANAGPVAVENALRDAVLNNDTALAAAALDRLDAMPKESKKLVRFSKKDVAESLVADEWTAARKYIAISEIAVDEAELANNEAEGKSISSQQKIGLGIKKRELANILGVESMDAVSDDSGERRKPTSESEFQAHLDSKYPGRPLAPCESNFGEVGNG